MVEIRDEGTGKVKKTNRTERIDGNRVFSSFFSRFVIQQNQFLLANGVTLKDEKIKKRLGIGFDKTLERLGEKALTHGVAWGFWNVDHLEVIEAIKDKLSGAVALVDERTSEPKLLVQFWQVGRKRPELPKFQWINPRTAKEPRHEHVAISGNVRPVGEEFLPSLRYPGDPQAPASQTINCHCYIRRHK